MEQFNLVSMETDRKDLVPKDENQEPNQNPSELFLQFDRLQSEESSGEQMQESCEKKKHHTHHGIGRYRSYSNHSSANDQPHTNTGW